MKSKLKDIFKRLEKSLAKPLANTVEFLMVSLVLFIFRFILVGTTMCSDTFNITKYLMMLSFSFVFNCFANTYEKMDGPYDWATITSRTSACVFYAMGQCVVIGLNIIW